MLAAPCGTLAGGSTAATHPSAPSRAQVPHEPSWSASSRSTGRRCSWRGPSLWGSAGESTTRRRRSATYHATHTTAAHVAHRLDTILCAPGDRPLLAVTRLLGVLCVLLRALCCATLTLLDLAVPAGNRRPGRHLASAARAPGRCLVGQATVQERGGQRGTKVASRVRERLECAGRAVGLLPPHGTARARASAKNGPSLRQVPKVDTARVGRHALPTVRRPGCCERGSCAVSSGSSTSGTGGSCGRGRSIRAATSCGCGGCTFSAGGCTPGTGTRTRTRGTGGSGGTGGTCTCIGRASDAQGLPHQDRNAAAP